ncbi:DUF2139 domain-containing protein [Tardisphaera miroshnichenkoae]
MSDRELSGRFVLVPEGYTPHGEVALGHHQFRSLYVGVHPRSKALVIHDGHVGAVYADGRLVYSYEKVGRAPKSGGDTHAAMANSRDYLFFGGWIKAPAGVTPEGKQDMREKYSHIHSIDSSGNVELLWSRKWDENLGTSQWYGEVTDLLYDEHTDSVFFTRGDGFAELGLWRLELGGSKAEYLVKGRTAYKMELKDDKLFITEFNPALDSNSALIIYDLLRGQQARVTEFSLAFDGSPTSLRRQGGGIVQLQNRLLAFYRGFVVQIKGEKIGSIEPSNLGGTPKPAEADISNYLLYPFFEALSPEDGLPYHIAGLRGQKAYVNGIPLLALVPWDHLREPLNRTDVGILVRFDGSVPQIVTSAGSISGLATDGEYVYMGASYANHTGVYTHRAGVGGVFEFPVKDVFSKPWTPVRIWLWDGDYVPGSSGIKGWFGGIPLKGFGKKLLKVRVDSPAKLTAREYAFLPDSQVDDAIQLNAGWNRVDLGSYYDMVAFSLDSQQKVQAELVLEP